MRRYRDIWKIVLIYALFGAVWIYTSDTMLGWLIGDQGIITKLSIFKGLFFITATSALLYFLIARLKTKIHDSMNALRESEERFQFLVENSSDILIVIDADGNQRFISHGAEDMFGFPISDMEGKRLKALIHAEDMGDVNAAWKAAAERPGEAVIVQYRHIHAERGWTYCEAVLKSFLDDPAVGGILASVRDITERKEAENRLKWHIRRNELLSRTAAGLLESGDFQHLVESLCRDVMAFLDCQLFFNYLDDPRAKRMRLNAYAGIPSEKAAEIEWLKYGVAVCGCVALERSPKLREDIQNADDDPLTELVKSYGVQVYCCHPLMVEDRLVGTLSFGSRTRPRFDPEEVAVMASVADLVAMAMSRIETEQMLRRSEALLKLTQRITKVGGWEWDVARQEMFWTDETYRIHDFDINGKLVESHDVVGRSIECYTDEDRPQILSAFNRCVERGDPYDLECRFVSAKGRCLWIRTTGEAVWEDGAIVKVHGSLQDITEQKRSEQFLWDRNQFINTILDNLPIGLAVNYIDAGSATYINKKFEEIYGWPREELRNIEEFFTRVYPDKADRDAIKARILGDVASGDPARMAWDGLEATGKDGRKRIISAKNIPLYEQNLMISTVQDITESRTLQKQLIQAQKLESIGRLAGGVAHDFNNILTIILGYAEMAMEKIGPDDPLHKDITEIYKAAERSSNIIRQLLAFARRQTTAPKVIDLNGSIESILKMLRRLIGEDIELSWLPGVAVWPVKIDPAQVDQILANLCVNARDAISGVGRITIETKKITIDAEYCAGHAECVPGDYVLLAVSDDGAGMSPDTLEKIFEPFFTTKALNHGTGLGLSTVYGIVKQNNGFINVYSEPGKGTIFKSFLPRHTGATAAANREKISEIPLGNGETILLVEDDVPILKLGERMLRRLGYGVLSAATPGEALRLADDYADGIHLLITDVVMPEMNGRELSERIRERCPGLKALFMSGYTADVIAHRGVLEEGVFFISKPLSRDELAVKVRGILDGEEG